MQDIWKLEKHCVWSGIVCSDHNSITSQDFYLGSKRSKSDYLSASGQFVAYLTLCIVCLMGNGSDGETGVLVPTLFH